MQNYTELFQEPPTPSVEFLVNSCELFERYVYQCNGTSNSKYISFLSLCKEVLLSISPNQFELEIKSIDRKSKELLLDLIGKLSKDIPSDQYLIYTLLLIK